MGFMDKVRSALARFMAGRNGWDALNQALLILYAALWILGIVVAAVLGQGLFSWLFTVLMDAALLVLLFRLLSRNIAKREAENLWWLNSGLLASARRLTRKARGLRGNFDAYRARRRDTDHRYFTCKHCGTLCRVPAGKGKIVITCPKCGQEIRKKT